MDSIIIDLDKSTNKAIKAAALLEGIKIEEFILNASLEQAQKVLNLPVMSMSVSASDFLAMQEALDNPSEPNENLKRLMRSK